MPFSMVSCFLDLLLLIHIIGSLYCFLTLNPSYDCQFWRRCGSWSLLSLLLQPCCRSGFLTQALWQKSAMGEVCDNSSGQDAQRKESMQGWLWINSSQKGWWVPRYVIHSFTILNSPPTNVLFSSFVVQGLSRMRVQAYLTKYFWWALSLQQYRISPYSVMDDLTNAALLSSIFGLSLDLAFSFS